MNLCPEEADVESFFQETGPLIVSSGFSEAKIGSQGKRVSESVKKALGTLFGPALDENDEQKMFLSQLREFCMNYPLRKQRLQGLWSKKGKLAVQQLLDLETCYGDDEEGFLTFLAVVQRGGDTYQLGAVNIKL